MFFVITKGGQTIEVTLQDGTIIKASMDGITLERNGKKATVNFETINLGKKQSILKDIDDLDVKDVYYLGDDKLETELRSAMAEQFESQRRNALENLEISQQDILDLVMQKGRKDLTEQAEQKIIETANRHRSAKENEGIDK